VSVENLVELFQFPDRPSGPFQISHHREYDDAMLHLDGILVASDLKCQLDYTQHWQREYLEGNSEPHEFLTEKTIDGTIQAADGIVEGLIYELSVGDQVLEIAVGRPVSSGMLSFIARCDETPVDCEE